MPRTKALRKPKPVTPVAANGSPPERKPPVDLAAMFRRQTAVLSIPDFRFDDRPDSGIRIEVASFRSEESLRVFQEYRDKAQQAEGDEREKLVTEGVLTQLVTVTKRWWHDGETTDGIYIRPGELLACTDENKRMVYATDGWQHIRDFVIAGFMEEANFFGAPPRTV